MYLKPALVKVETGRGSGSMSFSFDRVGDCAVRTAQRRNQIEGIVKM